MAMAMPSLEPKKRKLEDPPSSPPLLLPDSLPLTDAPSSSHPPSFLSADTARLMVDVLSKDDLSSIVLSAILRHRDILEQVRSIADRDPSHRKIFVRGLSWETSSLTLRNTFSEFGELEEAITIMDRNTGKSRGYGFVTFRHMDGAINALREPSKRIDGRICVCQLASVGSAATQPPQDLAARKIYVGNVPLAWPVDRLLSIFSEYGDIEEGPLGLDKQVGKERGFALFIYKTAEATKRALDEPIKNIDGHQLFCKLAVEGAKQRVPMHGQSDVSALGSMPSNIQYGSGQYGTMTQGAPYNHNMNAASLNQGISSALHPNAGGPVQSTTSTPSGNPTHVQPLNIGGSQINTTMGYGGHGAAELYGSQGAAYGGQPAGYASVGPYNAISGSQTSTYQGHYGIPAYQNQQQLSSYQTQQQASGRAPPAGAPLTSYYGM